MRRSRAGMVAAAALLFRLLIPARPVHLAIFGAAAIAAHLLGGVPAETAMTAAFIVIIAMLAVTIALDCTRPSYTRSCR